jgi:hypothetical protein
MKEMFDIVFQFIGWLSSLWILLGIIWVYRRLSSNERKLGTSSWGSILMELLKVTAAPLLLLFLVWLWFGVAVPRLEAEAPQIAAKSRTGQNILDAVEDPCSSPGLGKLACGDDPNRMGEAGPLASGEQASAAAGMAIAPIPSGPQPVLLEGEEALRTCYQAWYASFSVDGASKIKAGLPPDGKSNVSDWLPSTAGNATLVIQTPAGIDNNTGTLSHWLLPAPIQLEQDVLKKWHPDDEGTWSVSGTGSWPENCYTQPTPEPPPTAVPVTQTWAPRSEGVAYGGNFRIYRGAEFIWVPDGTELYSCGQSAEGYLLACGQDSLPNGWYWLP